MTLNNSNKTLIEKRREAVARLRLQGRTIREIAESLAGLGIVNPKTGRAYSPAQILADLKAIESQWQESALADITTLKARLLAELGEVKRSAWLLGQLETILKAIAQEAKIGGVEAAAKYQIEFDWRSELPADVDPAQLEAAFIAALKPALDEPGEK